MSTYTNSTLMSDYTFLERSVHEVYIWIWFIIHVWRCDRFAALKWHRIRSLELKSYVTIFILLALPLGSFSDIFLTKIVYSGKLYYFPNVFPHNKEKSESSLSTEDKKWIGPISYSLMIEFSFQIGTLFLMQCFWNYLSNSIAKNSFMSKFEFKLYIFLSIISVIMFPIILSVFSNNDILCEAIPKLVYGSQLIILAVLGIKTHYRFSNLIQLSSINKNASHIITKLRYFVDMNRALTFTLFITGASFILLGSDVLITSNPISSNKIASDILVAHINFSAIIGWIILVLIFYPRKGFVGTGAGGNSLHSTVRDSISSQPTKYASGLGSIRDSYININSFNTINDQPIESDKYLSTNDVTLNESPISSQILPAAPTPVVPSATPPSSISSNSTPPSITTKSKLKRNISLSRDGKMVYGDTEPLGKVGGSEFVAVEKVDPSVIPYYFTRTSLDTASHQSSRSDDPDSKKTTQEERMLVLKRQQEEFNSLKVKSQPSLLLSDTSSAIRSQQSELLNNDDKSISSSANIFIEDQRAHSVLTHTSKDSEVVSYVESDDGYFYAM